MSERTPDSIELAILDIISYGMARTGAGFGKLPLGSLAAVERLIKLHTSAAIERDYLAFKDRLEQL